MTNYIKLVKRKDFSIEKFTERFWSKVLFIFDMSDEDCWEWIGHKDKLGYGSFYIFGKNYLATHSSWFLKYGIWPKLNMLHKCDCPSCINPSHLFEGTKRDNNHDMMKKGRECFRGVKNGQSILTEQNVLDIRTELNRGSSNPHIAKIFGVHESCISKIKNGTRWKHIV
jgi:hypothetical protein